MYRRKNGKIEGRYRPRTRWEFDIQKVYPTINESADHAQPKFPSTQLKLDETMKLSFHERGFRNGYFRYEFLK
jgi:hypothetical protein